MNDLTIGKVSVATGVPVATIRFYEREGLLAAPGRNPSGYRIYTGKALDRLRFIVRAKVLGFSLEEIRELLMLKVDTEASCAEIRDMAAEKVDLVREKIRMLQNMENALVRLSAACRDDLAVGECPILNYLSEEHGDD